ncbi:LysR family transcriptional regulator [Marinobacter halodurans]|uniref:LysR family transcriptional regulator n=1 Tax=Marinobacter halodurans TaxID=2528979 RepID=A0ABY1ZKY1_9GAMM|nr:LysR family transcriptional regulator [Marinobacter halodurans]TBW56397.1 LysR family transcriptional regulator [Marinobacter halodurans]
MNPIDQFNLDIRSLSVFLAVLDEGSVSAAAVRLGVSQSAVSHTLDRLRQALGDPLFVKAGRGITPTRYALDTGPHVRQLVQELRGLALGPPFTPAEARLTVTIAANDYQRDLLLPALARVLQSEAPGIELQVTPSGIPTPDRLRRDLCDLMITPHPPPASDILQRRLLDDRMVVFYDPTQREAPADMAEYLASRHISIVFNTGERLGMDEVLASQGMVRDAAVTVSNFSGLPAFLRGTPLLASAPARLKHGMLRDFAVAPLPFRHRTFSLYLLWHQRHHKDPAQRWVRNQLLNVASQLPEQPPE